LIEDSESHGCSSASDQQAQKTRNEISMQSLVKIDLLSPGELHNPISLTEVHQSDPMTSGQYK
jgi:hypothetical protein